MGYQVKFGENNLHEYCHVLNVTRSIMPSRNNLSKSIPSIHGSYYTGYRFSERQITLDVAIITKDRKLYMEEVSKLAEILNVSEPQELIIDDEPYKMYYAVPDGATELSKFATTGKCSITFVCHDPIAYSAYWNTYEGVGKTIGMTSYGNVETSPIVDVDFNKNACFFQLTNPKGQTVLIGQPKSSTSTTTSLSDIAVTDDCSDVSTFTSLSETLLDVGNIARGTFSKSPDTDAIICRDYGDAVEGKWTGASFKKQLSKEIQDFEVEVSVVFSSQGQNYVAPQPAPPVPQPTPPAPPSKPSNPTTPPSTKCLGTYKVVNCGGLWINKTADTSQPLYAMAPGTYIYPTEIRGNWAKHTHSNKWNTFTGWSSMKYLQKVSDSQIKTASTNARNTYADEQVGKLEVYGFDKNGIKLFKFEISDTNEYYEYVDPTIYIGATKVAHDNKNTPSARQENGTSVASGVFGDFNDFKGKLIVKRETNSQGQQLWTCSINKIENGKVVAKIETNNSISSIAYPTGKLAYLGFYIGRYDSKDCVDVIGVTNVTVRNLNYKTDSTIDGNVEIFKSGDHMQIDFETGLVTINDLPALTHIDIGSEFFDIPPGYSEIAYRSDDSSAVVACGFKDRFV